VDNKKLLLDVAVRNLYDSLHQGEFGGVSFENLPSEEKEVWRKTATLWITNFLSASYDLAFQDLKEKLKQFVIDNEFPIDNVTQLMVIRSELLFKELDKLRK